MSVTSKYPAGMDDLPTDKGSSTNAREGTPTGGPEGAHSKQHNETSAAINAVQETLGTEPQGDSDTVAARLHTMKFDVLQFDRRVAHRLRGRVFKLRDVRFERFLLMRAVALPETEPHCHDDHQQNQQRGNEADLH